MERALPLVGIFVLLVLWEMASPHALESLAVGLIIRVILPIAAILVGLLILGNLVKNAFKGW